MSATENQIVRIHDMVKTFGSWDEWDRLVSAMSDQYGPYVGPETNTSADTDSWQSWNNGTSVSSINFDGRLCPDKYAWQWANNYTVGQISINEDNLSLADDQLVPKQSFTWTPATYDVTALSLFYEDKEYTGALALSVPYIGGSYKIYVKYTNADDFTCTVSSAYSSRVSVEKFKHYVVVNVNKNTAGGNMLAAIKISITGKDGTTLNRNINISQNSGGLSITPTSYTVGLAASKHSAFISYGSDWKVTSKPDWITVFPDNATNEIYYNNIANSKKLDIDVSESSIYREGAIIITCNHANEMGSLIKKEISLPIIQTAEPIIEVDNDTLQYPKTGSTKDVIVSYINALDYTVTVDVDWLSIVKNKNTVSITALENTSDARTANVTFSITSVDGKTASTTVVINQSSGAASIVVMSGKNTNNPSIGNFTFTSSTKTGTLTIRNTTTINTYYAYGSYAAVPYRVQCDASWEVESKPDWILMDCESYNGSTVKGGAYHPYMYIKPNFTGSNREGDIVFRVVGTSSKYTLTVTQASSSAAADVVTCSEDVMYCEVGNVYNITMLSSKNNTTWRLFGNAGNAASSLYSKCTPKNGNFTSSNNLNVNLTSTNSSLVDRVIPIPITGAYADQHCSVVFVNIKGKTYSWHPGETPPADPEPETPEYSLSLSKNTWNASQTTSATTVDVTSYGAWTATSNATWLTVNPSLGAGDEEESTSTVTVSVTENTSTSTRTGKITFVCGDSTTNITKILTVTQDAYVPPTDSISLSKTSWTASNSASETTVTVTSSGIWNASANQSWISVAPSIGPSGRIVQIAVTTNSSTSSRNGTVTFECGEAVATLSITQNAGSATPTYTYDFYLTPSPLTLDVGSSQYMFAWFVTYNNGIKVSEEDVYMQCIWTTDDSDIASVSSTGNVTGIKSGYTYVNAEYNGFYAYSGVNVTGGSEPDEPDVETTYELKIDPSSITVQAGSSTSASAVLYTYENGSLKTTQNVSASWSSSNPSIATVSGGTVAGVAEGNTQITASYNGHYAYAPVNVTAKPVTVTYELEIYPNGGSIQAGSYFDLTARYWQVVDGVRNGYTNMTSSCSWSSGNTSIATVSGGTVAGRAVGNTTVTVSYGDLFASVPIAVIPSEDEPEQTVTSYKLELSPSSISIRKGETGSFTATYYTLENGSVVSSQVVTSGVTWTSGNTSIATVSGGTVTGKAVGNTSVTATYQGQTAVGPVYVTNADVSYSLSLTPSSTSISAGSGTSLAAKLYTTTNGVTDSGKSVTNSCSWSSSDSSIATVSSSGYVSGVSGKYGTVTITASYSTDNGPVYSSAVVTVNYTYNYLELSASNVSLKVGDTYQLSATYYTVTNGASSSVNVTSSVEWSGGSGYVSCNGSGLVTALQNSYNNTFSITASYGGKSASCGFIVNPAQQAYAISLSSTSGTFAANGASRSTTVTSTLNGSGTTWGASSSDSWISVSPVSGSNGTSVNISVSKNSGTSKRYGSVTFSTGPVGSQQSVSYNIMQMGQEVKTLDYISVSPTSVSNFSNKTSPITVTAYYTDGTSAVVTNNLRGNSTNNNIAYYASGVIYHVNPGNATITISHTHNGVTKSATVSTTTQKIVPVSITLSRQYISMNRNSTIAVSADATLSDGTTYSGPNISFNTSGTVTSIAGQSGNAVTIVSGSSYGTDDLTASYTFNGETVYTYGKISVI